MEGKPFPQKAEKGSAAAPARGLLSSWTLITQIQRQHFKYYYGPFTQIVANLYHETSNSASSNFKIRKRSKQKPIRVIEVNRLPTLDLPTGHSLSSRRFCHPQYELFQGPPGSVILRVGTFEREIELEQPAIELASTLTTELHQAFFGGGQVADRPVAEASLRQGLAQPDFAAGALGLREKPRRRGVSAERSRQRADDGQRMLAGVQQAVELRQRVGRFAGGSRIYQIPRRFAAPATNNFLDLIGRDLASGRDEQREFGKILIKQAENRTSQIKQMLSRIERNLNAMLRLR